MNNAIRYRDSFRCYERYVHMVPRCFILLILLKILLTVVPSYCGGEIVARYYSSSHPGTYRKVVNVVSVSSSVLSYDFH